MSATQYAALLNLVAKHGSENQIKYVLNEIRQVENKLDDEIISVIALKTIEWLSFSHKLVQLYQFSKVLQNLGFVNESNIGFGEIESKAQDPELQKMAQDSLQGRQDLERRMGLPEWYIAYACQRSIYREKDDNSDYQCFRFENPIAGKRGTVEFFSLTRLKEGGFSNFVEWEAYLKILHESGVVSLLEVGYSADYGDKVYCLYEMPVGMKTLAECMSEEDIAGFITPLVSVGICRTLARMLADSNLDKLMITCVDPLNVLWNPLAQESIKLINVGASLSVTRYHCGIVGCREPATRPEIGNTTITYYIGLLLLQLLRKKCPIYDTATNSGRKADGQTTTELLDIPGTPPQLQSIIRRLTNSEPEYRYTNLAYLHSDLDIVWEFLSSLPGRSFQDQRDNTWYTLWSHTEFRLDVALRNPKIQALSSSSKVYEVLEHVSWDLDYLTEELLSLWDTSIRRKTNSQLFPAAMAIRDLNPEGRRLLGIAQGWESKVASLGPTPDLSGLAKLILYRIVSVEATACASSLAKYGSTGNKSYLSGVLHVLSELESCVQANNGRVTLLIEIPVHKKRSSVDFRVDVTEADIGYLREFLTWSHGSANKAFEIKPMPLKTMALVLILLALGGRIVPEPTCLESEITTRPVYVSHLNEEETWQLVHYLSDLDRGIEVLTSQGRLTPVELTTAWLHTFVLVRILRKLGTADRRSAMIQYSQRTYTEGSGYAHLVAPHWGNFSFNLHDVFISGSIRRSSESKQPARVDIVKAGHAQIVTSVLAPTDLFRRLPKPDRLISPHDTAEWIRKNQKITIFIAYVIVTLSLSLLAMLFDSVFVISMPWLTFIAGLGVYLVPDLIVEISSSVLDNFFPEDASRTQSRGTYPITRQRK